MKQIAEGLTIPKTQEDLIEELREAGADVTACYQCGRCSAGCPGESNPPELQKMSGYIT